MKLAASYALAELTKFPVPESVLKSYKLKNLEFGSDYIVPKAFDPRAKWMVSSAVAKAAIESGVAQNPLDLSVYQLRLGKEA